MKFAQPVIFLVFLPRLQEGAGGRHITLSAVDAVPADSEPPAVVVVHISPGVGAFVDWSSIPASGELFGGAITKAGQTHRVVIDPGRRSIIPMLRSICCSVLRTFPSLRVWFHVCLRGETTWLLSSMLQVCSALICLSSLPN